MKKALVRIASIAGLAIGVVGLTALPALAWHGIPGGTSECNSNGTITYTFTVQNWNDQNPGTVTTRLGVKVATETAPAVFTETIKATSDSLDWSITWANSEETGSGTIDVRFDGTCEATKVLKPRARLVGPCGDPFYKAIFDNSGSTNRVVFRFSYLPFGSSTRVVVKRTVPGGAVIQTGYKHVTGGTLLRIRALGHALASKNSAPAGNYGACQ